MNRVMRSDILKKKKVTKKRVQCVDGSSPSASTVCHLYLHEQAWEKLSVRTFTAQAELSHLTGLVHVNSKAGTVLMLSPVWPVPSRPPKHCCTLLTCLTNASMSFSIPLLPVFLWKLPRPSKTNKHWSSSRGDAPVWCNAKTKQWKHFPD